MTLACPKRYFSFPFVLCTRQRTAVHLANFLLIPSPDLLAKIFSTFHRTHGLHCSISILTDLAASQNKTNFLHLAQIPHLPTQAISFLLVCLRVLRPPLRWLHPQMFSSPPINSLSIVLPLKASTPPHGLVTSSKLPLFCDYVFLLISLDIKPPKLCTSSKGECLFKSTTHKMLLL